MLAYSSISQAGYMLIGIAIGTAPALTGATIQIFAHVLMKGGAFLVVAGGGGPRYRSPHRRLEGARDPAPPARGGVRPDAPVARGRPPHDRVRLEVRPLLGGGPGAGLLRLARGGRSAQQRALRVLLRPRPEGPLLRPESVDGTRHPGSRRPCRSRTRCRRGASATGGRSRSASSRSSSWRSGSTRSRCSARSSRRPSTSWRSEPRRWTASTSSSVGAGPAGSLAARSAAESGRPDAAARPSARARRPGPVRRVRALAARNWRTCSTARSSSTVRSTSPPPRSSGRPSG